jgi:hypothetical protein
MPGDTRAATATAPQISVDLARILASSRQLQSAAGIK